jgi:CDP-paratose 2-epimerase
VPKRIVITGGAGFVGTSLAIGLREGLSDVEITALDNLVRRGSELNLPRLARHSVRFVHGDIRCVEDLDQLPRFDLLIDCSAEPSVLAGISGSPARVIQNNLSGTLNCMEAARRHEAALLFLSTSRVYPIDTLNALATREEGTRFVWTCAERIPGFGVHGIGEEFPLEGARSVYGATKLAAELLLKEYAFSYSMPVLINRCGVIAGPWQMGKVDQGVITLWVARHVFGEPLSYIGFGGSGKQVRDVLHVADLVELVGRQIAGMSLWDGRVYNVGGGVEVSTSLLELTSMCEEATGSSITIAADPCTRDVDIRIFVTDSRKVRDDFSWQPERGMQAIVSETAEWVERHTELLRPILSGG